MAEFEITSPTGETFRITAPDDATPEQIQNYIKSNVPAEGGSDIPWQQSVAEGAASGLTAGFSDELEAGVRTGINTLQQGRMPAATARIFGRKPDSAALNKTYQENLESVRARHRASRAANPVAHYGSEFAGAVVSPVNKLAKGMGLIKSGGLIGGVHAAGHSEGDLAQNAQDTAIGVATGGVLGAGAKGVQKFVAPALAQAWNNTVRPMYAPKKVAAEKLGERLVQDLGEDLTHEGLARARQRLVKRSQAATAPGSGDQQMRVMDIGGRGTRRLMRTASNVPNKNLERYHNMLNRRQRMMASSIEGDIEAAFGNPRTYYQAFDDIAHARSAAAKPAFEKVKHIRIEGSPELTQLMQAPTVQRIKELVSRSFADRGQPLPADNSIAYLHRVKVLLDKQITNAVTAEKFGQVRPDGFDRATLVNLKNRLKGILVKRSPGYGRALDDFAGQSALMNAGEMGQRNGLKMPVEQLAKTLANKTDGELDMFRLGVARAIAEKVMRPSRNNDTLKNVFDSPDMQRRLDILFKGNNRAKRIFQKRLVQKARQVDTRRAAQGNSTTAEQLFDMEDAKKGVTIARGVGQAVSGRPLTGLQTAASAIGTRAGGINPEVAAEMLRLGSRKLNSTTWRAPVPRELERYLRMQELKVGADPVLGRGLLGGATSLATPR